MISVKMKGQSHFVFVHLCYKSIIEYLSNDIIIFNTVQYIAVYYSTVYNNVQKIYFYTM